MRMLIYEYITGGGLWHDDVGQAECQAILPEGRAMIETFVSDLLASNSSTFGPNRVRSHCHVEPVCFRDTRFDWAPPAGAKTVDISSAQDELHQLTCWAQRVDAVMLIAPELHGRLSERCRLVEQVGGRLVSPDAEFVQLTSDKTRTAEHLRKRGVAVPHARVISRGESLPHDFSYPAVLKPVDGTGAIETRLITDPSGTGTIDGSSKNGYRLEVYCPGTATSVAMCGNGAGEYLMLRPCQQRISDDGTLKYLGGHLPLPPSLEDRAKRLAVQVSTALPPTRGYYGIDMILGPVDDGSSDIVLEVNPRLTTSYVGLSRAATCNLAECIIRLATGQTLCDSVQYRSVAIDFDTEGQVRIENADPVRATDR